MPEDLMWVSRPANTAFSSSRVAPGSLSPLLRDSNNALVGGATFRPAEAPRIGFALAGVALVGLTVGAIALATHSWGASRREHEPQLVEARQQAETGVAMQAQRSAPAGWYLDAFGLQRWWDGQRWTDHVQSEQPRTAPPAGWYDDGSGRDRWWDGHEWTEHRLPSQRRDTAPRETASVPTKDIAVAHPTTSMSRAEWQMRVKEMLLARAFSDAQWRSLSNAHIEDADTEILAWQTELRQLTPQEFAGLIQAAIDANPELTQAIDAAAPGWYDHASGHSRWWDGGQWTEHVLVHAVKQSPGGSSISPGWYDDGAGNWRWWDGQRWTEHFA